MPVTDVTQDMDTRTLTITAEFAAPVERVWQVYADPRQLEQVWGPPTHPATFVEHELTPGTRCTYYMTAPDGQRYGGWWQITEVDAAYRLTFDDGFADAELNPVDTAPVSHNVYTFEEVDGGTRAVYVSTYDSAEALQQVLDMGVVEGSRLAIDQIDGLLAA
ncbi:polyketide cyclase [Ornithinimicrobium sp. CNJ-824]|uniref:SRPBCC family protein n=1 Tax=Ornithinimicrobium sp. CNJ-824 TaxID=1904966 RepID=UPI0009686E46|nr:SRPBCC domain-containing protein [Ornithinimicrobium sp. CNJ-824]OLT22831.1 polyketide cyclase [Ornithinimicrobium sp. CNJ-824]